ncbi:MAG: ABC transporter ATP-binding protein [Candidatus Accumulibacter sp.]|jgi:ABC-2 type transport system ATP-binding protein|nr:ABC transporter ATP-binding protein [Accumulibacter sp.]
MIVLEELQKRYGERLALAGVSLHVQPGELFAYLGPNGAGKSTTIRILAGLTRLSGGRAVIGGVDIEADPRAARRQCGLVVQHANVDNELSLADNMDIHGRLFGMPADERARQTRELLAYVDLGERRGQRVATLSGGMKRRLMIARALMHRPKVLFLDEPTAGLDADIRRRLWGLIKSIQADGATIFLSTHYIEEAEFLADRVAFLDAGRLRALDTPAALKTRVGEWAVDRPSQDGLRSDYFSDHGAAKYAANHAASVSSGAFTLRRVSLEDAFLRMTGKEPPPC